MANEDVIPLPPDPPQDSTPLDPGATDPAPAPVEPIPAEPSPPETGVEEPAPDDAIGVDPITLPPVDVTTLPPVMQEEIVRNAAWTEALQAAESTIGARVEAEKDAAREALRSQGELDDMQIEVEVAQMPISFNVAAAIKTEAMAKVIQYVMVDTADGKPLRLNDRTTLECGGDWELLDANDIDVLRSMEAMGYCKAIIRPPGWEPKVAK